jgi:hypothetical protein
MTMWAAITEATPAKTKDFFSPPLKTKAGTIAVFSRDRLKRLIP